MDTSVTRIKTGKPLIAHISGHTFTSDKRKKFLRLTPAKMRFTNS